MDMDREQSVQHFLDLIKKSHRGKFKIYIGMIAGVGKSYRMLQEAHDIISNWNKSALTIEQMEVIEELKNIEENPYPFEVI